MPVASRTWLGWATPAVQAEPVEHSMPWASSSSSRESPSQPGKVKWALAGSRLAGRVAAEDRVGHGRADGVDQVVAQGADLAGEPSRRSAASRPATAKAAMAGTSRVPERTWRSWPPPCSTGTGLYSRPSSSAPMPYGPPILWPETVIAASPEAAKSTVELAEGLDRVGVQRDAELARRRRPVRGPA